MERRGLGELVAPLTPAGVKSVAHGGRRSSQLSGSRVTLTNCKAQRPSQQISLGISVS